MAVLLEIRLHGTLLEGEWSRLGLVSCRWGRTGLVRWLRVVLLGRKLARWLSGRISMKHLALLKSMLWHLLRLRLMLLMLLHWLVVLRGRLCMLCLLWLLWLLLLLLRLLLLLLLLRTSQTVTLQRNLCCTSCTCNKVSVHVSVNRNFRRLRRNRELSLERRTRGLLCISTGRRRLATFCHDFLGLLQD